MSDAQSTPAAGAPAPAAPMAHAPNAATPATEPATRPATAADTPDQGSGEEVAFQPPVPLPREYQLPSWQATQKGLQVDFVAEQEMREVFHTAGVDQNLASSLYTVALAAAGKESTPLSIASDYVTGERSLRMAWGADFEGNLKVANEEGRRLFEAMPESIRRGLSYRDFALAAGFANSAPIAKMLLMRARTRSGGSNSGR